jgi:hypothetical protein
MSAHGPKHSDISMIHIDIQNDFRDMRYLVKSPYQLKYQIKMNLLKYIM